MAWTWCDGQSREVFRRGLDLDDATWARGRGWALWKALITVADERERHVDPEAAAHRGGWRYRARETVDLVLDEPDFCKVHREVPRGGG